MDLTKTELLAKCAELGLTKYKSKNKAELLKLLSNNNKKHLTPLIKWSGGKSDEIKMFEKYFPDNYNLYIEPFIGGGSVYFYLNPDKAVINDIHKELIDLYQCIGEGESDKIYEFMGNNPNDEETYYKIRDEMIINDKLTKQFKRLSSF
jgi:DNA adenine methylase